MTERILLKNTNLFDVENGTLRDNWDILIEDGILKDVGKVDCEEGDLISIDCSGKFALPGLFECHAHLALLTSKDPEAKKEIMQDFGTSNVDELEKQVLKEFVIMGITQVRDVGGPVKNLKFLKDRISKRELSGPDIYYAGPMLEKSPLRWEKMNKMLPGLTVAVDSKEDAERIIEEVSYQGANLIKTFNKFDVEVFKYLLDLAVKYSLPVAHDPGTALFQSIPMDRAIDLGIKCIEHAKAPWPVVLKDDLKKEHDALLNASPEDIEPFRQKVFSLGVDSVSTSKLRQLMDKMLENEVFICTTLHAFKHLKKLQSKKSEKDTMKKLEVLDEMQVFFTGEMIKRNVKILVGQDGLIPEFTFDEMRYLNELGLSESEIIRGATSYPAKWLGISDKVGSISPNKKANILILDKNPLKDIQNIKTTHVVLLNGKIVI
jgi:imidazolonepropionase-like amidohydrolase